MQHTASMSTTRLPHDHSTTMHPVADIDDASLFGMTHHSARLPSRRVSVRALRAVTNTLEEPRSSTRWVAAPRSGPVR